MLLRSAFRGDLQALSINDDSRHGSRGHYRHGRQATCKSPGAYGLGFNDGLSQPSCRLFSLSKVLRLDAARVEEIARTRQSKNSRRLRHPAWVTTCITSEPLWKVNTRMFPPPLVLGYYVVEAVGNRCPSRQCLGDGRIDRLRADTDAPDSANTAIRARSRCVALAATTVTATIAGTGRPGPNAQLHWTVAVIFQPQRISWRRSPHDRRRTLRALAVDAVFGCTTRDRRESSISRRCEEARSTTGKSSSPGRAVTDRCQN